MRTVMVLERAWLQGPLLGAKARYFFDFLTRLLTEYAPSSLVVVEAMFLNRPPFSFLDLDLHGLAVLARVGAGDPPGERDRVPLRTDLLLD